MTTDEVIKRLESEYHLDQDHGWKILLKRLEGCEAQVRDYEAELERHATDRINQRKRLEKCEAFADTYADHLLGCACRISLANDCDCGFIEADAARAAVEGK